MDVPVIIEPVIGTGYRAIGAGGLSVGLSAEGATAEEAVGRLADQVRARLHAGAMIADMTIAASVVSWKQDAGYLRDDPLYDSWREAIEAHRRRLDEDPEAL